MSDSISARRHNIIVKNAYEAGKHFGMAVVRDEHEAAVAAAKREGMEMAAGIADDFGWVLPLHGNKELDETTDDAACAVCDQIAAAIRAELEKLK